MMRRSFSADHHPAAVRYEYPGGSPLFAKEWRTMRLRDSYWLTSELPHRPGGLERQWIDSALSIGAHRNLPPFTTE